MAQKIKIHRPSMWQEIGHRSKCRGLFVQGGNRSGKSDFGAREDWYWLTGTHPWKNVPQGAYVWIVSQDNFQSRAVMQGHTDGDRQAKFPCLVRENPGVKITKKRQEGVWLFPQYFSKAEFKSCDSDPEKFGGSGIHIIHFDEVPKQAVYTEAVRGLTDTNGPWMITATAVKGESCWTHKMFWEHRGEPLLTYEDIAPLLILDTYRENGKFVPDTNQRFANYLKQYINENNGLYNKAGNPLAYYNPIDDVLTLNPSAMDNFDMISGELHISQKGLDANKQRYERTGGMAEVSIRVNGWPAQHSGKVYTQWSAATHIVNPRDEWVVDGVISLPDHWRRVRGIDWGWSADHPLVCEWLAQSPSGTWYVYREYTTVDAANVDYKSEIIRMSGDEEYYDTIVDPRSKENIANMGRDDGTGAIQCTPGPGGRGDRMARYKRVGDLLGLGQLLVLRDPTTGDPVAPQLVYNMGAFTWPSQHHAASVARDQPLDKDNDAIDAVGYPLLALSDVPPPDGMVMEEELTPEEWQLRQHWKHVDGIKKRKVEEDAERELHFEPTYDGPPELTEGDLIWM